MELDAILHVMAKPWGAEVVSPARPGVTPGTGGRHSRQCRPHVPLCAVAKNDGILHVALADPLNPPMRTKLRFAVKSDVQICVADPAEIDKAMERLYGQKKAKGFNEILKELGSDKDIAREVDEAGDEATTLVIDLADEAPIVKFVNVVLQQAVQDRASDIHFEPFETEFRIRYRVDGALYEMAPPPKHLALPVISRLKVMASLNISERRMPQDGRISRLNQQPPGGFAHVDPAHRVRRIGRVARAGPRVGQSGNRGPRLAQVRL